MTKWVFEAQNKAVLIEELVALGILVETGFCAKCGISKEKHLNYFCEDCDTRCCNLKTSVCGLTKYKADHEFVSCYKVKE